MKHASASPLLLIFANVRFSRTLRPLGLTLNWTPPIADECDGVVIATFGRMWRAQFRCLESYFGEDTRLLPKAVEETAAEQPSCGTASAGMTSGGQSWRHQSMMDFCTWSRFSASSNTAEFKPSITSEVTSSPLCAGRQCMNRASGFARDISSAFTL